MTACADVSNRDCRIQTLATSKSEAAQEHCTATEKARSVRRRVEKTSKNQHRWETGNQPTTVDAPHTSFYPSPPKDNKVSAKATNRSSCLQVNRAGLHGSYNRSMAGHRFRHHRQVREAYVAPVDIRSLDTTLTLGSFQTIMKLTTPAPSGRLPITISPCITEVPNLQHNAMLYRREVIYNAH